MPRPSITSVALLFTVATARPAFAQQPPTPPVPDTGSIRIERTPQNAYRFRLLGVYDEATGAPIPGVDVSDLLTGVHATTTVTGTVSLYFLPEGGSFVRLRKVGYGVQTVPVSISPADTAPITLTLAHATELAPVVVRGDTIPHYLAPGLQGFAERASHGLGHFITEADLRKSDNRALANLLTSRLPGVMSVPDGRDPSAIHLVSARKMCQGSALSLCRSPNCFVSVFIDGAKIYPGGPLPDFNRLSVQDYGAVEFYETSETPPEFSEPGMDCGTLVLWSRER